MTGDRLVLTKLQAEADSLKVPSALARVASQIALLAACDRPELAGDGTTNPVSVLSHRY